MVTRCVKCGATASQQKNEYTSRVQAYTCGVCRQEYYVPLVGAQIGGSFATFREALLTYCTCPDKAPAGGEMLGEKPKSVSDAPPRSDDAWIKVEKARQAAMAQEDGKEPVINIDPSLAESVREASERGELGPVPTPVFVKDESVLDSTTDLPPATDMVVPPPIEEDYPDDGTWAADAPVEVPAPATLPPPEYAGDLRDPKCGCWHVTRMNSPLYDNDHCRRPCVPGTRYCDQHQRILGTRQMAPVKDDTVSNRLLVDPFIQMVLPAVQEALDRAGSEGIGFYHGEDGRFTVEVRTPEIAMKYKLLPPTCWPRMWTCSAWAGARTMTQSWPGLSGRSAGCASGRRSSGTRCPT